jgi:hypothetical protein
MPSKLVRRVGIRLFELGVLYGVLGVLIFLLIFLLTRTGSIEVAWPMLYGMVLPMFVLFTVILLYFMPVSCRVVGNRVVMRTPVRSIEAVLLGEPRLERGGLIPPGRTKALFCFGWRFPTTLFSDCDDELFFSTPDCDGRWLVAEAKLVNRKREEKRTLWICGCAGH